MENKYGPGSESNSPSQYFVPATWKMWLLNNRFVIKYSNILSNICVSQTWIIYVF